MKWYAHKYGGGKTCNLGNGFKLVVVYPITKEEGHKGYVNGLPIGEFDTQEECMKKCEQIAKEIIIDLYKKQKKD